MSSETDMNELLQDAMENVNLGVNATIQNTYEKPELNNNSRWTGKVINNNDPEFLGRVKVLISGVYDELAESALPWAVPDINYIGGSNGSFIIPENGTFLRGYFDQGDIQKPVFDSLAFTTLAAKNTLVNPDIGIAKLEDYPNKMVLLETDQGESLTLNKKTGETEFRHRTGFNLTIAADGSLSMNIGESFRGKGKITVNCGGDTDIITSGTTNIKSDGTVNIDSTTGDVNLGRNPAKQLCNNLTNCILTGIPHFVGNTNVKC